MKTLVIHPKDTTTDVLSIIYEGKKNWKIINHYISNVIIKELIKEHDRIIMMGHGTPNGLLGYGRFIINSSFVYLLKEKKENVYIWCNADKFVKKYKLNGFTTGMIISEEMEADYCNVKYNKGDVENSIVLFSESIRDSIDDSSKLMCENVIKNYNTENNSDVLNYNRSRIYYF